MDANDPDRKIAVLTAIVQTMMAKQYEHAFDDGPQALKRRVDDDDPLALAINSTLSPEEIAHAFKWAGASLRSADDELRAMPVVPYLSAEQRERVRTMLVASDAADEAYTKAVGPGESPPRDAAQALEIGERTFVEAMTNDALAQRADVPELATDADVDERIAVLPEPWRSRTRHELEILKGGSRTYSKNTAQARSPAASAIQASADSENRRLAPVIAWITCFTRVRTGGRSAGVPTSPSKP